TGPDFTLPTSVTTASVSSSDRTMVVARWSGGTATTTRAGRSSGARGRPAPSPEAVRTCSDETSLSRTSTPAARRASPIEVPSSPAPITSTGPGSRTSVTVGDRPYPRQVAAQGGRPVQVDVGDLRPREIGLDVRHHPDHPRHRPGDLQLARADERHLAEAELPRDVGGELRVQVGGRGEDDRDEVVDRQPVALHH